MSKKEVVFEIVEHIGVISRKNNSTKELNLVSWAGRAAYEQGFKDSVKLLSELFRFV